MLSQAVGTPHISTTPSQHNKNSQHPTLLYSPPSPNPHGNETLSPGDNNKLIKSLIYTQDCLKL